MAKCWSVDCETIQSLAETMTDVLAVFPKQLLRIDEIVRKSGMPLSYLQVLILLKQESVTIGVLSDRLGIAKPNITPVIDKMTMMGYTERCKVENDRRVVLVQLTEKGREKLGELQKLIADQMSEWPQSVKLADARCMQKSMQSMIKIAKELQEQ